jgi:hypothetical protein
MLGALEHGVLEWLFEQCALRIEVKNERTKLFADPVGAVRVTCDRLDVEVVPRQQPSSADRRIHGNARVCPEAASAAIIR